MCDRCVRWQVANWVNSGTGRIAFSRGARAFVAIAMPSQGVWSATLQTGLPAGTYCDVAAGSTSTAGFEPACASQIAVGSDGRAQVNVGATGVHVVALHVEALAGRA